MEHNRLRMMKAHPGSKDGYHMKVPNDKGRGGEQRRGDDKGGDGGIH